MMQTQIQPLIQMESDLDRMTSYTNKMIERSDDNKIKELSMLRKIPYEILKEAGVFYVDSQAELLLREYLTDLPSFGLISPTNSKPIYHQRWVFPIRNEDGKVINFVGYSNLVDERYVYATSKYYSRTDTLFGLENLAEAYKLGYAILTEGITDSLAVRGLGFKNVFAWCGTVESKEKIRILNRCRYGVIRIPDRDRPGEKTKDLWQFNRYYTLVTAFGFKDSAEMIASSDEMREHYKTCLLESVNWILQKRHNGRKSICETGIM